MQEGSSGAWGPNWAPVVEALDEVAQAPDRRLYDAAELRSGQLVLEEGVAACERSADAYCVDGVVQERAVSSGRGQDEKDPEIAQW